MYLQTYSWNILINDYMIAKRLAITDKTSNKITTFNVDHSSRILHTLSHSLIYLPLPVLLNLL